MNNKVRVTVWNEYRQEPTDLRIAAVYPDGIHNAIADGLKSNGFAVQTATLDQPEHGLSEEALANTDVLVWWSHIANHAVSDEIVERVQRRVLRDGMGLIVLHSACMAKIFQRLIGTTGDARWREDGEKERLWVVAPGHPIAAGLGEYIELPHEEMYGEHFDIPAPDELVFISWFQGGEVFRSGCCFNRGLGRIFYFRPGHEEHPTYFHPAIQKVLANACKWAAPASGLPRPIRGNVLALEKIPGNV
jgi:trehalose utilization protein